MTTHPSTEAGVAHVPVWFRGDIVAWSVIDVNDYADINRFKWHLTSRGYARRMFKLPDNTPRVQLLARYIMGCVSRDGKEVDHVNRIRLDNRRCNLRVITHAQNCQNLSQRRSTSKYRGVSWHRATGTWQAMATLNYRQIRVGNFYSEEDAAIAVSAFRTTHMPFSAADHMEQTRI